MKFLKLLALLLFMPAIAFAQGGAGGNGTPPGAYGPVTGSASAGGGLDQTANPLSFGAKWDVKYVPDCSWTNATQTVTCPDGNFSAADVGKIMFGTRGTAQVNANALTNALDFAQGTITGFTSATVVTVSTVAGATCPDGSHPNCNFVWGTQDDTAAITAAQNAAWNGGNSCKALQLPAGAAFISSALFNGPVGNACGTASGGAALSDLTSSGPILYGQGQMASVLIPLPSFNFASCTAGSASTTCFGAAPNLQAHDLGINGMSQPVGGSHLNILWESFGANGGGNCDGGATVWNLSLASWAITATSSIGFQGGKQSCNDPVYYNVNVMLFGQNGCAFFAENTLSVYGMLCFGAQNVPMQLTGGNTSGSPHIFNSYGSAYYASLATGLQVFKIQTGNPVVYNSYGDHILNANIVGTQFALFRIDSASTVNFFGSNLTLPTNTGATTILDFQNNGGSSIHFRNSTLTATGVNNQLFNIGATDKIFDEGGNSFTNGTVANSLSGSAFGFTNSANVNPCATGNFALTSGWGTSSLASVAANGNILGCHLTITGAAGTAGPVLTWTYPSAPIVAPSSCHLSGPSGTLTGVSTGTPGATTVAFTFTGTPSAQTYVFDIGCP